MNFTTLLKFGEGIEAAGIGDKITFGLQVVGIGVGVVFGVLILLIGILQLFKLFAVGKKKDDCNCKEEPVASAPSAPQKTVCNEEEKIVAIASAAIAASRGKSDVDFTILSIAPIGGVSVKNEAPAVNTPVAESAAPAEKPASAPSAPVVAGEGEKIAAPLPGNILDVKVSNGANVKKGDILCILEAMKMENEIVAPNDGTIVTVATTKGSSVNTGDLLFVIG